MRRSLLIVVCGIVGFLTGSVAQAQPSSDTFQACVTPSGVVRSQSIRMNQRPSCYRHTDDVVSWGLGAAGYELSHYSLVQRDADYTTADNVEVVAFQPSCPVGDAPVNFGYWFPEQTVDVVMSRPTALKVPDPPVSDGKVHGGWDFRFRAQPFTTYSGKLWLACLPVDESTFGE